MRDGVEVATWQVAATSLVPLVTADGVVGLGDLAVSRGVASCLSGLDVLMISTSSGPSQEVLDAASSLTCVVAHQAVAEALSQDLRGSADVRCAEPSSLPFPSGSFNGLLCPIRIAEADPEPILAEFARTLSQPDGILILTPSPSGRPGGDRQGLSEVVDAARANFEHFALFVQRDCVVSLFEELPTEQTGTGQPAVTVELPSESFPTGRNLLIGSNSPLSFLKFPIGVTAPLDVALWEAARSEIIEACAQSRAVVEANDSTQVERDLLLRELFLSEQTLAASIDASNQRESVASLARLEVAETRALLADTGHDLVAARAELVLAHAEIARQHQFARAAHEEVLALRSSTSWRVTRPLRLVKSVASLIERHIGEI